MNEIILSIYDKCYEDKKYKEQKIDSIIFEDEENGEKIKQIEKKNFFVIVVLFHNNIDII